MSFYGNLSDLVNAVPDEEGTEDTTYLARCIRRYFRAQEASKKLGYVGVGCITFAEDRLVEFQRRVADRHTDHMGIHHGRNY